MISRLLIIDVDYILRLLHLVDLYNVADVSEAHAATIFRI
jgi:hypothetical protein